MCCANILETIAKRKLELHNCLQTWDFHWPYQYHAGKTNAKRPLATHGLATQDFLIRNFPSHLVSYQECGWSYKALHYGPFGWKGMTLPLTTPDRILTKCNK